MKSNNSSTTNKTQKIHRTHDWNKKTNLNGGGCSDSDGTGDWRRNEDKWRWRLTIGEEIAGEREKL